MKPKFRSLIRAFAPLSRTTFIVCASLCAATSVHADQTWTGATDAAWGTLTNWSGGALPLPTENAVFNATSTANLTAIALGANRTINGITFTSPASDVTIVAGSTLNLNAGGINMSGATANLTSNAGLNLSASGQQNWSVAGGRTLTLASLGRTTSGGIGNLNVGAALAFPATGGTVKVGTAARGIFEDGQGNPYATYGVDNWAATDATGLVIPAVYLDFPTAGALTGAYANWNVTGAGVYTMNGVGPASFRLGNSGGTTTITNSNTSTLRGVLVPSGSQSVSIEGGFIRPNRSASGSGGNSPMNFVQNSLAGDLTVSSNIANAASSTTVSLVKSGVGKMIISAATGYTGGTFINGGTLQIGTGGAGGAILNSSLMVIQPGASFVMNVSADPVMNGAISGSGSYTQLGSGTTTLGGASAGYTGTININGGAIAATSLANIGSGTTMGINGGQLKFLGAFDPTAKTITIGSSGATFNTNGNSVSFASAFASGSSGAVTKSGTGSLTLAADNDYSGGTAITGGSLLANAPNSSTGSGAVAVNSGSSLGGTGKIAGAVSVASGANLSPGASVGTLTVGSLDLAAGSTATFEFKTGPDDNDKVAVLNSGGLTINGGAITLLQENSIAPFTGPGGVTYNLISYTGSVGGAGTSSLSVANPQSGFSYTFGASGGFVTLTINTTGIVRQWNAAAGGSWGDDTKWTPAGAPNIIGATANFTTAADPLASVTLDGNKTVGSMVFTSGTNGYTIAQGTSGSLILNNGVAPAGITSNDGNHEISAPITLNSNTTVTTAAADDSITLSGVITGSVTLTKNGPGGLSLLGNNTLFSGAVTLNGGTTTFANNGLGTGNLTVSGNLVWSSGNSQDISNRTISFGANPVTFDTSENDVALLAGPIGNGGAAAFTKAGSGRLTLGADATFTGITTISGGVLQLGTGGTTGKVLGAITNNAALDVNLADGSILSNVISGTGSLVKNGAGTLSLNAANTFTGSTAISAGTLRLLNSLALQGSTLNYSSAGGALSFNVLTAATLGGLQGDLNLNLMNADAVPAPVALTVGGNNSSTSYSGTLSGGGSLIKLGTGALTLGNVNTYTGATTVSAGDLDLAVGGSLTNAALTVNGTGKMKVTGGNMSVATSTFAVNSGGLNVNGGTATFATTLFADGSTGSSNSALIKVESGVLTAPSIVLGRTGQGNITEAPVDTNLYITNGEVRISGDLMVGTYSSQPNSAVVTRVDGGLLKVDGAISVGLNSPDRMSILLVNGGDLVSTGTGVNTGVVLGGPWFGRGSFYVQAGTATVERIQIGQGAVAANGLIRLSGGTLYVGSGGISVGTTASATTEIRLDSDGTLAAKNSWSTNLPVNLTSTALKTGTIKAADANGVAKDITLNGALTGVGNLTKTGGGTLTLTAGHAYTGYTQVNEGTLSVTTRSFSDTANLLANPGSGGYLNLNFSGGDRVGTFSVDNTEVAAGIYGSMTNTTPGIIQTEAITGDGLLYVNTAVPLTPYDTWAQTAGLTPLNEGPTQDPDNDGIANELEFVLGGNPLVSSTNVLPLLEPDAGNFIFTFNRQDVSVGQVALVFQYGTNLSGWTDVAIPETTAGSVTVTPGTPADAVSVSIPKGANPALFGRLKAVK